MRVKFAVQRINAIFVNSDKPINHAHENQSEHGGGKSEYLTPEITAFDIAVERGFAEPAQLLDDITYDDSWESANQ